MKLEDIFAEWDVDSEIDSLKLDKYSIEAAKLHSKYARYLSNERLLLKKYESEYKQLKLEKMEFYVDGPTEEQMKLGWVLPPKGRILKSDAQMYIDADKDIVNLSLKIGLQQEKVEVLKSIIDVISKISFNIRSAIDWQKFISGS